MDTNNNDNDNDDTSSDEAVSQFLAITGSSDPSQAKSYIEMSANDLQAAICLFLEHQGGGGGMGGGMGGGIGGSMASMGGGSSTGTGTGTGRSSSGRRGSRSRRNRNSHNSNSGIDPNDFITDPDGIRAPDQTRTMRLMDFDGGGSGMGAGGPMPFYSGVGAGNPNDLAGLMNHPVLGPHATAALMRMSNGETNGEHGGMGMEMPLPNMSAFADDGDGDVAMDGSGGGDVRDRINALAAASGISTMNRSSSATSSASTSAVHGDRDGTSTTTAAAAASASSTAATSSSSSSSRLPPTQRLADMFAAPSHLIHRGGGFQGARNVAKDSRRWLLVNLQCDADFACHALNRDVWRDELVENLVREGFVFWQDVNSTPDGRTYEQRYNVETYPHIAILDPRTSRLIFRKEGWTQENPLTAEQFAECAADFCSRNSFDKPPSITRRELNAGTGAGIGSSSIGGGVGSNSHVNPTASLQQMTEEEQLQAAIRASMNEASGMGSANNSNNAAGSDHMSCDNSQEEVYLIDSDDEDVATAEAGGCGSQNMDDGVDNTIDIADSVEEEEEKEQVLTFHDEIIAMEVGEEPTESDGVARIMIRMPDGKRLVRKFKVDDTVKVVYAFVSQSNEDAQNGKEFEIKAGFPPKNLLHMVDDTIQNSGLAGDSVTVRWKEE